MSEHAFLVHLKEDHVKQKNIGKKLVEAKDPAERQKLREEFYDSLFPHIIGEEASLFAKLVQSEDEKTRDDALEGLQEHHVAKIVLRELMEMSVDTDIFKAKAKVLDELNRHHIEEEEEDVFEHLKKLATDELDLLYREYEKAEKKAES